MDFTQQLIQAKQLPEDFELRTPAEELKKANLYMVLAISVKADDDDPEILERRYSQIKLPAAAVQEWTHHDSDKLFLLFTPEKLAPTKKKWQKVLEMKYNAVPDWEKKAGKAWEIVKAASDPKPAAKIEK